MPTPRDGHIVKIAVEMDSNHSNTSHSTNYVPQLIEFDQNRTLSLIITDLCANWSISDCEQYSLQFNDSTNAYITDKNRNDIKNGSVLRLTHSPSRTAQDVLERLKFESSESRLATYKRLVKLSADYTFALEFINKQGLQFVVDSIEKDDISATDGFGSALESFVELMNHAIISWDNLEPKFIGKIAQQVNASNVCSGDRKVLIHSLAILESIVISSTKFNVLVEAEVTLPNLISLVSQNQHNPEIQQNSIALINALFSKSDLSKRKSMAATLGSKRIRNVILTTVLNPRINSGIESSGQTFNVGSEMAHQLYVLQTLLFNLHEERVNTSLNAGNETEVKERILELRKTAFDSEFERTHSSKSLVSSSLTSSAKGDNFGEDYKRLGFTNSKDPVQDFAESPGMLALDLLVYLARNHTETYVKFVLENCSRSDREHECPLVKSTVQLTRLLCEMLKVSETPSDEGKYFYPMFFTHDHPLEEFYCIVVSLLNKTWKEMRATVEDFVKVFSVLRQQLGRALSDPESTVSFDKLKLKLASLSYSVITSLWQKERNSREEWENKAYAILELRDMVKPEIIELIKQQRLLYLTEGTRFDRYSNKGQRIKDKFWYCRLSSNQKFLCYGDCDENKVLSVDELSHKFAIIDIKQLVVGKDCPHMKDIKTSKKSTFSLAFSLIPDAEQESPLNFVAQNDKIFDYWVDGINALIGQEMSSKETNNDLETLLSMDIKIRLLDTEGVTIPERPPEIPPSPPNYDFCLKY